MEKLIIEGVIKKAIFDIEIKADAINALVSKLDFAQREEIRLMATDISPYFVHADTIILKHIKEADDYE
jgi:hypothetical protein